jgi:hypothetical protein
MFGLARTLARPDAKARDLLDTFSLRIQRE